MGNRTFLMAALVALACSSPARAAVVISDGFGDADINNNGMPLENVDVDIAGGVTGDFNDNGIVDAADYVVWRDNLGALTDDPIENAGDDMDGVTQADYGVWKSRFGAVRETSYVPARLEVDGSDDEPENNEVTAVLDPGDTGIRWIQMRGFTDSVSTNTLPGAGESKPTMRIVDDSQGAMRETMPTSEPGGLGIAAIDDGYAMSWESRGQGSSAAGFFGNRIALGPEVDDEVKVSFDFRVWRDAANLNDPPNNEPLQGELRFGLYQDTDNQIGMTNPFAGRQVDENGDPLPNPETNLVPAVWGEEEGMFEGGLTGQHGTGDDIGTNGDNGWSASVFMGDPVLANGGGSRLREEVQNDRILQGNDVHTVAQPEDVNPDPFIGEFDFINMDVAKVYSIEMSLRRATDTDPGDTIFATVTVTDKATGVAKSFGGLEQIEDHTSGGVPVPGTGGPQSDSWDYFAIRNASGGLAEFDFILDNFLIEVIGSNAGSFSGAGTLGSTAAVPEPSCILLASLAAMWMAAFSRRRA